MRFAEGCAAWGWGCSHAPAPRESPLRGCDSWARSAPKDCDERDLRFRLESRAPLRALLAGRDCDERDLRFRLESRTPLRALVAVKIATSAIYVFAWNRQR